MVRVVASQGDERAQAESIGEEDLGCCVEPHLSDSERTYSFVLTMCVLSHKHAGPHACRVSTSDLTSLLKSGVM